MADGSKINLQILGVERQSVDITLDPADAEVYTPRAPAPLLSVP